MQPITYKEACEILDVKYVTIKDAVLYGRLTKCAMKGTYLLKEQVILFKNKRISINSLNMEERKLWEEYKNIAESPKLLELAVTKKDNVESIAIIMANQKKLEGKLEMAKEVNKMLNHCIQLARELAIDFDVEMPEEVTLTYPY